MADAKQWSAIVFFCLILYFVGLVLTIQYGTEVAKYFDIDFAVNTSKSINLEDTFSNQASCDYPRYKYNSEGDSSRYLFDLDNLDCEISAGAISEKTCEIFEGCTWINETSGFLWFRTVNGICSGNINKTFYNDNIPTDENLCKIDGLQGNENVLTCSQLGCTSYEPKEEKVESVTSPLTFFRTVGDLFLFRFNFGFQTTLHNVLVNMILFYFPFALLLISIYLLSPFSN